MQAAHPLPRDCPFAVADYLERFRLLPADVRLLLQGVPRDQQSRGETEAYKTTTYRLVSNFVSERNRPSSVIIALREVGSQC